MLEFLNRLFHRGEEEAVPTPEEHEEVDWEDSVLVGGSIRMRLNTNMPVTILGEAGEHLCTSRMLKSTGSSMVLGRLPGEIKLPSLNAGQSVTVSAFNIDSETIRLSAKVKEATAVSIVLYQLEQIDHITHRGASRLPVNRAGEIFVVTNGKEHGDISCKVVDISMTGACIETTYKFAVGDSLRLRFELMQGDGVNSAHAEVVWSKDKGDSLYHYGLLFEELDGWKKKYLRQSIDELQRSLERSVHGVK